MNILHIASVLLELAVTILGIKMVMEKKPLGYYIAITFGIYVFYDFARFLSVRTPQNLLDISFLIASISIFLAVKQLSERKKK